MIKKGSLTKYEKQSRERIIFIINKYCDGSQQQFADLTGINKASVSQYVNGRNVPSNITATKIANVFNVNPAWINGFDVPMRDTEEPPASNIFLPDAYSVPILDRISCGNGSTINHEYKGEFVLDRSIRADYCLIASGDSMIDAGIEDGDRVFMRKVTDYQDGKIYGVVLKSEDLATLKRVYFQNDKILLQPCNHAYKPICLSEDEVYIVGECIGIFKTI